MRTLESSLAAVLAGLAAFAAVGAARADELVIKQPNAHPSYKAELEPHANLVFWHRSYGRYGKYRGVGDAEVGAGFRATIELGDPAFIPRLNNTVGITFGLDLTSCRYCDKDFTLWSPVGLNWSFFLTRKWSTFADLGFVLRSDSLYHDTHADFFGMVGGRYHFNDDTALTVRIGYPFVSVGASFFVG
jgi:hypothetical protein